MAVSSTPVNSAEVTSIGAVSSLTLTFGFTPTSGNLLLAVFASFGSPGWGTLPSGWKQVYTHGSNGTQHIVIYKISNGAESSVALGVASGTENMLAEVSEWSGCDSVRPIQQHADFGQVTTNDWIQSPNIAEFAPGCVAFASNCADLGANTTASTTKASGWTEHFLQYTSTAGNNVALETQYVAMSANTQYTPSVLWNAGRSGNNGRLVLQPTPAQLQYVSRNNGDTTSTVSQIATPTDPVSSVKTGELVIVCLSMLANPSINTITPPDSSWIEIETFAAGGTNVYLQLWYHFVTATEAGTAPTYTWKWLSTLNRINWACDVVTLMDPVNPIPVSANTQLSSGTITSWTTSSITPLTASNIISSYDANNANTNVQSVSTGWINELNLQPSTLTFNEARLLALTTDESTPQQVKYTINSVATAVAGTIIALQPVQPVASPVAQFQQPATTGGGPVGGLITCGILALKDLNAEIRRRYRRKRH